MVFVFVVAFVNVITANHIGLYVTGKKAFLSNLLKLR